MFKKKLPLLLFLVAVSLTGLYYYNKYRIAPGFNFFNSKELVSVNGNMAAEMEMLKGKKIILTFYASWCRDCLVEMKALNELKQNGKLDASVAIVAISDEPLEKITSFIERKKYPFQFFRFQKSFPELKVNSIPVNYLINTKGETVYEKVGSPDWEDADWVRQALRMME